MQLITIRCLDLQCGRNTDYLKEILPGFDFGQLGSYSGARAHLADSEGCDTLNWRNVKIHILRIHGNSDPTNSASYQFGPFVSIRPWTKTGAEFVVPKKKTLPFTDNVQCADRNILCFYIYKYNSNKYRKTEVTLDRN